MLYASAEFTEQALRSSCGSADKVGFRGSQLPSVLIVDLRDPKRLSVVLMVFVSRVSGSSMVW